MKQDKFRILYENSPDGIIIANMKTRKFIYTNSAMSELLGYSKNDFKKMGVKDIHPSENLEFVNSEFKALTKCEKFLAEDIPMQKKDGQIIFTDVNSSITIFDGEDCIVGFFRDVTKRKHAEQINNLGSQILENINKKDDVLEIIKSITSLIKSETGFEAIGIRLKNGDDFPYYVTQGFPEEFVKREKSLCSKLKNKVNTRGVNKKHELECLCGGILENRIPFRFSYFTDKGSFWSNHTSEIIEQLNKNEDIKNFRGECIKSGYESLALIPLRSGKEIIGLLQINDHRKDVFTFEMIKYFEGIGSSIGIAIERSRVKNALEESEFRYRKMFERINDAVAVYKAVDNGNDFCFYDVNKALEDIEKVKREDILGKRIKEVFPGVMKFGLFEVFKRVFKTGIPEHHPVNFYKDNRIEGWKDNFVYKLPSGEIVAVYKDVTKRKRADEELKRSEETLRSIMKVAPIGIGVVSDRIIKWVNDKVCNLVGYSREELIGESSRIVYTDDKEFDRVGNLKYSQIKKEGSGTIETRWKRKDGKIIDILLSSTPLDETDFSKGITFTVLDISERKTFEKALLNSEKQANLAKLEWEETFDALDTIIAILNPEFQIMRINKTGKEMLDLESETIIGQHCYSVFLGFDKPCKGCPGLKTLKDNQPNTRVINYPHLNKSYLVSSSPLMENGKLKAIIYTTLDITEHKRLEEQLIRAQKMEAVGTLAGGVAHDFNNLLQGIIGFTELLLLNKDKKNPDYKKLKDIHYTAQRGSDLTRQLLTFSRKVESKLRPINLNNHVEQVAKLLERTFPKMINVEMELSEDLWFINADPSQIEQIVINLAINSRDAIESTGEILIKTANVKIDKKFSKTSVDIKLGNYALITVSDNGCGMDELTKKQIYDPFFTTKETGKGTGLGLSSVYGIVENHKAYILCESEVNIGTTFKIFFPAIEMITQKLIESSNDSQILDGSETILIVDDDQMVLKVCQEMLKNAGYNTIKASSGEDAIKEYLKKTDEIDLVILDLNMPGMGGESCLEKLKKINRNVKVVISSGYSFKSRESTKIIGAKAFVRKPYHFKELKKVVRFVLDEE